MATVAGGQADSPAPPRGQVATATSVLTLVKKSLHVHKVLLLG